MDVKIEIHPKENPFYAIAGESLNIFCEAPGVGSETDSYLKWYKKTSGGEIEVDKSLVRREAFSHNGIGYDKEVISIPSSKKSDAGIYICKRQVSPQSKVISKQIEVIIQGRDVLMIYNFSNVFLVQNGKFALKNASIAESFLSICLTEPLHNVECLRHCRKESTKLCTRQMLSNGSHSIFVRFDLISKEALFS